MSQRFFFPTFSSNASPLISTRVPPKIPTLIQPVASLLSSTFAFSFHVQDCDSSRRRLLLLFAADWPRFAIGPACSQGASLAPQSTVFPLTIPHRHHQVGPLFAAGVRESEKSSFNHSHLVLLFLQPTQLVIPIENEFSARQPYVVSAVPACRSGPAAGARLKGEERCIFCLTCSVVPLTLLLPDPTLSFIPSQ